MKNIDDDAPEISDYSDEDEMMDENNVHAPATSGKNGMFTNIKIIGNVNVTDAQMFDKRAMSPLPGNSELSREMTNRVRKLQGLKLMYKDTSFGRVERGLFPEPREVREKLLMQELERVETGRPRCFSASVRENAIPTELEKIFKNPHVCKKIKNPSMFKINSPRALPGKKNKKFSDIPSRVMQTDSYIQGLQEMKRTYHFKQQINKFKQQMRCPEFTKIQEESLLESQTTRSTPYN